MGDHQRKAELYEQFARVGKALASPKRLELLDLLAQGERSVEDLAEAAEVGLSSCSAHLQVLHHARVVTTRKHGTRVFYSLASDDVARLFAGVRRAGSTSASSAAATCRTPANRRATSSLARE